MSVCMYQDLTRAVGKLPVVVGALGAVSKRLDA